MNAEFIPYQQALDLKELGFDEPCFGYYNNIGKLFFNTNGQPVGKDWVWEGNQIVPTDMALAPLYQQCFRFFREKYKLYHHITQYYGEHFFYKIEDMVHPRRYEEYPVEKLRNFGEYTSQEDAELACLIKLIEIVKDENKRL
jgi:hypothetical protein